MTDPPHTGSSDGRDDAVDRAGSEPGGAPPPRVALYLPGSTRLLYGLPEPLTGGVEAQAVHLVRAASHHIPLTLILYPPGPDDPRGPLPDDLGPVQVEYLRRAPRPGQGLRGIRDTVRDIADALRRARADIVVERMPTWDTLYVALAARRAGCRFIYHWSGNHNGRPRDSRLRPRVIGPAGFAFGRRMADAQLVQTREQAAMAGGEGNRVHLFPDLLDDRLPWRPEVDAGSRDAVLWLGTIKPAYKRPHLFLDLAAIIPEADFLMAGRLDGPDDWRAAITQRITDLPNVTHLGPVARLDLPDLLAKARLLVNTSNTEGFSSTFLEAAAAGVPVISCRHDPNGILNQVGMGVCTHDDAAPVAAVRRLLDDDDTWVACRVACAVVAASHRPHDAGARFARIMRRVAALD